MRHIRLTTKFILLLKLFRPQRFLDQKTIVRPDVSMREGERLYGGPSAFLENLVPIHCG